MSISPWMFQVAAETRPQAQLAHLTIERLRRTLGLVGTNARYRARLGGVEPPDIRTLDDWARLPFLTKDELRDAYPFGLTCAGRGNVMHGPDGARYPNESVFVEIAPPERVVIRHVSAPHFELRIALEEREGATTVSWRQRFDTADECRRVARVAVQANEENLDRLAAEVAAMT